jgi:uncharacterized damage-inducible protein DinB
MSIGRNLLPEFDEEMATTRRVVERVPGDKGTWKPHPRSFPLGHLTQLVATMPGWLTQIVTDTTIDLGQSPGYTFESTDTLLGIFDAKVAEARQALSRVTDDELAVEWSLRHGDKVLFSSPRGAVVRQTINHLVHHRGQLTVYLRLLDVPVPSIYGPTADEPWGARG